MTGNTGFPAVEKTTNSHNKKNIGILIADINPFLAYIFGYIDTDTEANQNTTNSSDN